VTSAMSTVPSLLRGRETTRSSNPASTKGVNDASSAPPGERTK
jgi:hypothetical protein